MAAEIIPEPALAATVAPAMLYVPCQTAHNRTLWVRLYSHARTTEAAASRSKNTGNIATGKFS